MSSNDRSAQESVTNTMPAQSRGEMLSLKTASAMTAVATISKLLRREALAAVVLLSPSIKEMGAAISSAIIASVKGSSFFVRRLSFAARRKSFLPKAMTPIPSPAPR